ncbi:MAG: hypothetical protein Q7S86_02045 [bacterium]|nr:hypothetical protein [bacterium]
MAKVQTTWFVEPLDATTNRVIAEFLTETEIHHDIKCADKKSHDLWDCNYRFIGRLIAVTGQLDLKFRLFRRKGQGQIEKWQFVRKRKRSQPAGAT